MNGRYNANVHLLLLLFCVHVFSNNIKKYKQNFLCVRVKIRRTCMCECECVCECVCMYAL